MTLFPGGPYASGLITLVRVSWYFVFLSLLICTDNSIFSVICCMLPVGILLWFVSNKHFQVEVEKLGIFRQYLQDMSCQPVIFDTWYFTFLSNRESCIWNAQRENILANPLLHLSRITWYPIRNIIVHVPVLNGILWDMGHVHYGKC